MKRVFSIFLTIVFLFNVIGYYGVYLVMMGKAQSMMSQKIDNNDYQDDQTLTVKIPIALPYPISDNNYAQVQGEFEHHGEFYKLVKQKYANDTLFVVCLKNNEEKKAFKVFSDFVKVSTDQTSANNQNTKTLACAIKDFSPAVGELNFSVREGIELASPFAFYNKMIPIQDRPEFSPPPEAVC